MDLDRLKKIGRIFRAAAEVRPEARDDFLEEACGQDPGLRQEVDTLLLTAAGPPRTADAAARAVPTIANYRLIKQIGEGGMGQVFLAEQIEPIRREVALKIIRFGLESREVVARFESERQALAMMDHPNIASVFDAGTTDDGRPFFVMEHVKGKPITDYCDEHRLTTRERLELLVQVCDGLQHAHQKAVIHRDIKPSNVLVAVHDRRAVPKIIDFGIAKATEQRLTERTLFTELGQLIGTPGYMSPEQAMMTGTGVDTRTDIYSLGVLMYELLVGVLPIDPTELREAGFEEMLRYIREVEPPRPSTRLSTLVGQSQTAASRRGTSAHRLTTQLRGELDWITMKALEKEPPRRYGSAAELADDVQRYLRHEPVEAGPPSAAYRSRKFIRRHRYAVATAAAALLVLVTFSAAMAVQAARIARERDRANDAALEATREAETARRLSTFMVDLFRVSDPGEARGNSITAREILDTGAERLDELDDQPLVQASFMETIGRVYTVLGLYEQGTPLLERAVEIREDHGDDELALAKSLYELALMYDHAGHYDKAEPAAVRSVALYERLLGDDPDLAESLNTLGNVRWHLGRLDEAETIHRRALAIREATEGPEAASVASSLHNIGALRYFAGDLDEAERLYKRAIAIEEATTGDDHYGLATSLHTLAIVYQDQQRYDEALALEERSLRVRETSLGPDHPHVALSLTTLGNIHRGMGDAAAAEPLIRRAVDVATRAWGETHGEVWWMRRSLARCLNDLRRFDDAEAELTDLIDTISAAGKEPSLPLNLAERGVARIGAERFDEAIADCRRAIEIIEADEGKASPYIGLVGIVLGRALRERGEAAEAEAVYRRSIDVMTAAWGEDDADRRRALRGFARLLRETGREDEAEAMLAEAGASEPE